MKKGLKTQVGSMKELPRDEQIKFIEDEMKRLRAKIEQYKQIIKIRSLGAEQAVAYYLQLANERFFRIWKNSTGDDVLINQGRCKAIDDLEVLYKQTIKEGEEALRRQPELQQELDALLSEQG